MTISIIIPVFNVEGYLRQGLDSVINQTYRDLDIVCVDDGSTDDCAKILEEYAQKDNRINVITQPNNGTAISRQKAVAAATGDYILFFDPDDWLELDTCEKVLDFALDTDADVIQYGIKIEGNRDEGELKTAQAWFDSKHDMIQGNNEILKLCLEKKEFAWNIIGKMFKSEIAKKAFSNQETIQFSNSTDIYASYYLYCIAKLWKKMDGPKLYHYRWGVGVSTCCNLDIHFWNKAKQQYDALAAMKRYALKHFSKDDYRYIIVDTFITNHFLNASLNLGLYRLSEEIDPAIWINDLQQRVGEEKLHKAIALVFPDFVKHCHFKQLQIKDYKHKLWLAKEENGKLNNVLLSKDTVITELEIYVTRYNKQKAKNKRLTVAIVLLTILLIILIFSTFIL